MCIFVQKEIRRLFDSCEVDLQASCSHKYQLCGEFYRMVLFTMEICRWRLKGADKLNYTQYPMCLNCEKSLNVHNTERKSFYTWRCMVWYQRPSVRSRGKGFSVSLITINRNSYQTWQWWRFASATQLCISSGNNKIRDMFKYSHQSLRTMETTENLRSCLRTWCDYLSLTERECNRNTFVIHASDKTCQFRSPYEWVWGMITRQCVLEYTKKASICRAVKGMSNK